jgi:dTMP kinase
MYLPRDEALVCVDGLDASGKQTQTRKLLERFDSIGVKAVLYSFPRYTTTVGKAILRHLKGSISMREEHSIDSSDIRIDGDTVYRTASEDALAFQGLCLMDKADAAVEIEQHLDSGTVVICDRWWQSAFAFGAADGLDPDWLVRVHGMLPEAWLNIFIDVPLEEALRRRPEARDRYERDREKQKVVRANYEKLWTSAGPDYVKIDGLGTEDEVHERIWSALENRP